MATAAASALIVLLPLTLGIDKVRCRLKYNMVVAVLRQI